MKRLIRRLGNVLSAISLVMIININTAAAATRLTPYHLYLWAKNANVARLEEFKRYINIKDYVTQNTALCIAHTCTSIALGIASVKDPVMGLDLETMRPVRSIEGMSRMSFGEAASAIVRQCAESGDSEPFFRAWGMKESEIKLNRGGSGWRLTLDEESRPVVLDPEGRPVLATHAAFGSLRLTVLTGACAPIIGRVTPADISRTLL